MLNVILTVYCSLELKKVPNSLTLLKIKRRMEILAGCMDFRVRYESIYLCLTHAHLLNINQSLQVNPVVLGILSHVS